MPPQVEARATVTPSMELSCVSSQTNYASEGQRSAGLLCRALKLRQPQHRQPTRGAVLNLCAECVRKPHSHLETKPAKRRSDPSHGESEGQRASARPEHGGNERKNCVSRTARAQGKHT